MSKVIIAKSKISANSLMNELNALVKERENFEKEEFARSNKRLYEILTKVYRAYVEAKQTDSILKETVKEMKLALQTSGERIQTNTLAINLFVRYVFRISRQRTHNYSRTLQAAYAKSIKPENLAEFIEGSGGVEECKRTLMKKPATLAKENSIKDTLPLVDEQLNDESQKLGEFKVSSEWVSKTYDKELTVMVGKTDKQGNIRVVSVIPAYSKGVTNWAKKQIAIFLIEKQAEAKKNEKVLRKKEALKSATAKSKKNNSATETVGELLAA